MSNQIQYAIMQSTPFEWDFENPEDQHIYEVIKSYDYGNVWHKYSLCYSRDTAQELVEILNDYESQKEARREELSRKEIDFLNSIIDPKNNKDSI